jgi:hypothetical protein
VYNIQNCCAFGFCPSSDILKTREHEFPEAGRFRPQVRGETPTVLGPLERANLNHWTATQISFSKGPKKAGISPPSTEDENRFSFRNVVFFGFFRIPDQGQRPKTQ